MDIKRLENHVNHFWDQHITLTLNEYIRIPNKSPHFDPDWEKNGHMEKVLQLALSWVKDHLPTNAQIHIGQEKGRTPVLLLEIPGQKDETILMYGHLDKQPEMTGWEEGLGPWTPVLKGDKLYGRGGADDGYALFASLCAIQSLQEQKIPHSRVVILIEFCEESGSYDLPFYVDQFSALIGKPNLVICLDSGAGNYEQFWTTTSLRGLVGLELKVQVLKEGVHSGDASGIVPSTFRIMRQLLDRLENQKTGEIRLQELMVEIPAKRVEQAKECAQALSSDMVKKFPFAAGVQPVQGELYDLILNRTWRPALEIVGQEGIPVSANAGNVLRPWTTLKLSLRLPPTLNGQRAQELVKKILLENPPYEAQVDIKFDQAATGWHAPLMAPWLEKSVENASKNFYHKNPLSMGEGGTIPFMAMLGEKFPHAQFVITGVLGPGSNAHGPNEFLHIPYAKKLTCCVAQIVADQFKA